MNRSIGSMFILLGILFSACASSTSVISPSSATSTLLAITLHPEPTETHTPTSVPTEIPVFWDDFSGEFLPGWSWIRENNALWSLDSEPGYLRIVLTGDHPPRNLLVRDVADENFQIMTHVRFQPTRNYQIAGLLVYQDDENFLILGRAYCNRQNACVGNGIYFDAVQNGQAVGSNFAIDTQVKDEAYLRMDKSGTRFTGYYSEDGSVWTMIGEHDIPVTDPKVGLITGNSFIVGMTAYFDYFTLLPIP